MPKNDGSAAASKGRGDRQSSESGDDHDNDNDQEHEHELDQGNENDGAAPTKRKRLTQACDPCRKKKIKCDGVKPSCANCTKLHGTCSYLPSMKKRGPRQGYIELLEKRLDKMEQLLQHGPAPVDPELLDSKSILSSRLRPGNRRPLSPTGDGGSQSDSNARADPEERYFGTTSGYTLQHTEYDKQSDPNKGIAGPKYSSQSTLPRKERKDLIYGIKDEIPRKDILDHLIELFFDSIYFQLPIIHQGTFMKQYKEGKVSPNLLNAMCAAVARFSNHPDVVTTPAFLAGEPFATNVRGMVVDSIDIPTVSNVQALLFLSMYEYGAARGPRAWMFGGMAMRQAQELGLNREDSSPVFHLKGDWIMRETRRRTFWACFLMDVLASSSSGRPRMIDERDCEVLLPLPSEDHDWYHERPVVAEMLGDGEDSSSGTEHEPPTRSHAGDKKKAMHNESEPIPTADETAVEETMPATTENKTDLSSENNDILIQSPRCKKQGAGHVLSSFAYLIRILAVLGRVSQYVNRPRSKKAIPPNQRGSEFSVIDAALLAWHKSIPPHLAYSIENAKMVKDKGEGCIIIFMHVIYHTAVVLLHRPILAADKAAFPMDSENSSARCADAASKVSDLLEFVQAYNSRRSLSIHVKILQTMKPYWSMADKFFYIIRDLYSIQSKISSSAKSAAAQSVSQDVHAQPKGTSAGGANGSSDISGTTGESTSATDSTSLEHNNMPPGSIIGSKLTSISSFLKSDSGLIALWRRATEMQVLDEAKQEQRRLSMSEESTKQLMSLEEKNELRPQDRALQEHRERMNTLEIQQINQEFDRRWKSKLEALPSSSKDADGATSSAYSVNNGEDMEVIKQDSTLPGKRQEEEEPVNPKATKQAKTARTSKPSKSNNQKIHGQSLSNADGPEPTALPSTGLSPTGPSFGESNSEQSSEHPWSQSTYRHSILQQPHQLQHQESYILQPMQIHPHPGSSPSTEGSGAIVATGDVNRHLMDVYARQHQQQEVLSQSIDMMQNANVQRQQQQLRMQQEQAAQMSSLAFEPSGGFSSSFLSSTSLPNQQDFSPQGFSSGVFGLPLVYGSNYGDSQTQRIQTESLGTLFDFALPQGDISFLSNSFQVPPTMMQNIFSFESTNSGPMHSSASPIEQTPGTAGSTMSISDDMASASSSSPAISGSSPTPLNRPLDSQSPSLDSNNLFNISPRLHAFLMSEEPYTDSSNARGVQATPSNLIRYLQLHQQEMQQQQLLQQQNMQPVLNQQNSLIFDDYLPWNQFSALQQQQQQPQQQQNLQQQQSQHQQPQQRY
ncbi:hypothetical protein BGZ58_005549 [Dissophora ornata]|nr:hypothetical protein BGZ58_005549 [Dissophora ornata]